jgi:predicted RNA-binding protein with PUA-like domain
MPDIDRSPHHTNYWLVKTEPNEFSFEDLVRDGRTVWDGVRNYQARNNLRLMRPGDLTLIYHSIGPKTVVGIARIISDPYPDPTDNPQGHVDRGGHGPRQTLHPPRHPRGHEKTPQN